MTAQIVSVDEEEDEIEALNLGMIAAYYYIPYTTIELLPPRSPPRPSSRACWRSSPPPASSMTCPCGQVCPLTTPSELTALSKSASAGHARAVHTSSELA